MGRRLAKTHTTKEKEREGEVYTDRVGVEKWRTLRGWNEV